MNEKEPSVSLSPARKAGATAALILLAVLTAAIAVCAVVGATETVNERFAMTGVFAAERDAGGACPTSCDVLRLPLPEDPDIAETYAVAEICYHFEGGAVRYVTVDNLNVAASVTEEMPAEYTKALEEGTEPERVGVDGLFRYRAAFECGWIATVVFPADFPVAMTVFLPVLACCLLGYFLGGINSGVIVSRFVFGGDIRKHGSGNPGATNMLRTYGGKAAVMTLLGDIFKVLVAMFAATFLFGGHYAQGISGNGLIYFTGLFGMVGHVFPPYSRFHGGKGVSAACALALYTAPLVAGVLILVFVALVALTRYVSVGSMLAGMLYPVVQNGVSQFFGMRIDAFTALASILVAVVILFCHRKNIRRLLDGTENKISFRKKTNV